MGGQAREIDWQCGQCGCRDANHFTRDGHYRRALETGWGHVEGLQVPMVECQCCGHDVVCNDTILEKYRRFWLDMDQQVLFGSGLCQSLRHLSQQWSAVLGSSVGLRTINERINQIEPLLAASPQRTDRRCPCRGAIRWHLGARANPNGHGQAGQTAAQAQEAKGKEGRVARRAGVVGGWQWQTGDPGLASGRWGEQSGLGAGCRIACGNVACVLRRACRR